MKGKGLFNKTHCLRLVKFPTIQVISFIVGSSKCHLTPVRVATLNINIGLFLFVVPFIQSNSLVAHTLNFDSIF